jgi:hypothetical protein
VIEVRRTAGFDEWLRGLRDRAAMARILVRIDRLGLAIQAMSGRSAKVSASFASTTDRGIGSISRAAGQSW